MSDATETDTEPRPGVIWVRTERQRETGEYSAALDLGDITLPMTKEQALAHAAHVIRRASEADYLSAVLRQLTEVVSEGGARVVLKDLLEHVNLTPAKPFDLIPAIALDGHRGYLKVYVQGELVGQWELSDAFSHAQGVAEAASAADLDSMYYHVLTTLVGIDEDRATAVVTDISRYRQQNE